MHGAGAIPLMVESPTSRVALIVDGTLPLDSLARALRAATGMSGQDRSCQFWEGQRQLDGGRSLLEQGVVAGSEIRLR